MVLYGRRYFLMIKEISCFLEYTEMNRRKTICSSRRSDIFCPSCRWNLWSTGVWGCWNKFWNIILLKKFRQLKKRRRIKLDTGKRNY